MPMDRFCQVNAIGKPAHYTANIFIRNQSHDRHHTAQQGNWEGNEMSELTEHLRHIGCLNKPRCIEAADLLDAQATELARLREQVVAQQARIVSLKSAMFRVDMKLSGDGDELGCGEVLREYLDTPDDLSALKQHDDALWNEALTRGVEWQATRGHTLDADDYENELRSLKR